MNSISFVVNRPPSAVAGVAARLGIQDTPGGELIVNVLGPAAP